MRQSFEVIVEGRPAPQGSKSYKGNGRFVEASKYLPAWRLAIVDACKQQFLKTMDASMFTGPVRAEIVVYVERPKKPKFDYPATPPDVDKLARGIFDSLTSAKVWEDDALCVDLHIREVWTGADTYPVPGAKIKITAL